MKSTKVGIIGLGYRGKYLLELFEQISCVEIVALVDTKPLECTHYPTYIGEDAYREMIDRHHPNLVIVASPWHLHVEQALYAVRSGADVALEVKAGLYPCEYDELITEANCLGRRVFPLENAVFKRECLAVLRMVEEGVLGTLVHLRGGYLHDLRHLITDHGATTEAIWRSHYYYGSDADIYPTHGLAPLALMLQASGDRLATIRSFASSAHGLETYLSAHGTSLGAEKPIGDIIISQITTDRRSLLTLTHDTTLPRPRLLGWMVQGTRGLWDGEQRRIYIEGISPSEQWEDDATYIARYEHVYWHKWGERAVSVDRHHAGMDYVMLCAMLSAHLGEDTYPIRLEDLALWCSITPMSERSIREGATIALPRY